MADVKSRRQILDVVSASVALEESKDTKVCNQKRMILILLARNCRDTGESRIVREQEELKGLLQLTVKSWEQNLGGSNGEN